MNVQTASRPVTNVRPARSRPDSPNGLSPIGAWRAGCGAPPPGDGALEPRPAAAHAALTLSGPAYGLASGLTQDPRRALVNAVVRLGIEMRWTAVDAHLVHVAEIDLVNAGRHPEHPQPAVPLRPMSYSSVRRTFRLMAWVATYRREMAHIGGVRRPTSRHAIQPAA